MAFLPAALDSYTIPSILLILTLLTYLTTSFLAYHRLRYFPTPHPSASFSYLWLVRALSSGHVTSHLTSATNPHIPPGTTTIRVGPNELLTSDPETLRRTSAARSRYTRSDFYRLTTLNPHVDAMFNTLDTNTHDRLKAQTAAGYAGKDVPGLEGEIDAVVAGLVRVIQERYATGAEMDMGEKKGRMLDLATMAQYFTLDSITRVAFGKDFGLVQAERDVHGHMKMLDEVSRTVTVVASIPLLRAVMGSKLVLNFLAPRPGDKKGIGRIMPMAYAMAKERFGPDAKVRNDMLGSFVRHGLDQRQCETEALFQIVAGSDTTATAVRATLLYIMTSPRVYHTLQAEIDAGIATGKISSPVKNAEAIELPYLQAVILEGLRLHPPVTALFFKTVPPEGDTIDGRFVPGGTLIAPNVWATGRHRGVFGPDADLFRPERWLEVDEAQRTEMRRVAELVFGYGRWMCAGKVIAFMELNKVLVELLRNFDFQLANPSRPWKSINYSLWLQSEMWVAVSQKEKVGERTS